MYKEKLNMNRTEHGEEGWLRLTLITYAGRRGGSPGKINERGVFVFHLTYPYFTGIGNAR